MKGPWDGPLVLESGFGGGVRGLGGVDHEQVGVTFVEGVLNVEEDVVERRMIDDRRWARWVGSRDRC